MEVQSTKSELQDNIRDQIMQTLVSDMTQMTKLHDDMQSDMRETETERTKKKESKTEAAKIHREIEVIENEIEALSDKKFSGDELTTYRNAV